MSPPEYPYAYQLYGLRLLANRQIPGLWPCQGGDAPNGQVVVDFEPTEEVTAAPDMLLYESPGLTEQGCRYLQVWQSGPDRQLCIRHHGKHAGQVDFLVKDKGRTIEVHEIEPIATNNIIAYLLGPVIGCTLRRRNIFALHAGVVEVEGRALAVIGDKGAGKSTLVACLAGQGCPILSDDIAPIHQQGTDIIVQPGYPRMRLWPDTLGLFKEINPAALPPVLRGFEKRYLDLNTDGHTCRFRFRSQPALLAAILILGPREAGQPVRVHRIEAKQAIVTVTAHTYAPYILNGRMQARQFFLIGALLQQLPVFKVMRPDDLAGVETAADKVIELIKDS